MKRNFLSVFLLLTVYCLLLTVADAGDAPTKPKIPNTPEAVETGKKIYFKRCSFCHGLEGEIAALLHDIGKLSVPDEILEKPGGLSTEEFNIMRGHTYFTYHILNSIDGFDTISEWAAFHHEKLNGRGYPFHLKEGQLSIGSRIMAVSDKFSALSEDRPYRKSLTNNEIIANLNIMVDSG